MISMADPTLTLRNAFTKRIGMVWHMYEWWCLFTMLPKKDARSLELKNISDLLIDACHFKMVNIDFKNYGNGGVYGIHKSYQIYTICI